MVARLCRVLPCKNSLMRRYASQSTGSGSESLQEPSWPKNSHPTPYEVFGIPPGQVDARTLKKRYHAMAKMYHPDIASGVNVLQDSASKSHHSYQIDESTILSTQDRQSRFQVVSEAYELLRDSRKKSSYDRFRTGWMYAPASVRNAAYSSAAATAHGYHNNHNYEYWNAGTWEDVNRMNDSNPDKKLSMWVVVAWMCGLLVCVQCTALLTRIEETLTKTHFTHDETEHDLLQAYVNYGLDTDKWSRLRRFLWFRTYGIYRSKDDLDREAQKNEKIVQELRCKEARSR
ncbi:LAME_0G18888g1_1 [Lachancea meyersii CBS 8951]|uniref:LAME_0G18888g1_1 n=1 Tax=Lachancea meyersii CBS 8951 TaxID=1266667 RepID=A0A1G4KC05_9SACH|nr:LAME_0G18888g1_1 [Lachancea meyersii CBS 8951]